MQLQQIYQELYIDSDSKTIFHLSPSITIPFIYTDTQGVVEGPRGP